MKFFANLIRSEEATEPDPRKEVFLKLLQDSQENTCARVSFFEKVAGLACNFIKKETLGQVFSCEFCEICKNTFFNKHLQMTAFFFVAPFFSKISSSFTNDTTTNFQVFGLNVLLERNNESFPMKYLNF